MKRSTRIIIAAVVLLALIIVGLVIVKYFQLPWLWPAEKWPDFWIALISGMIAVATIGALATFIVEQLLKGLEEERSKQQFRADCEREWAEFEELLYYRLLEEWALSNDIDYAASGAPHSATALVKLLETVPLSRWKRGLESPSSVFRDVEDFSFQYRLFKMAANTLVHELRENIDDHNRSQTPSAYALGTAVENVQLMFCLGLILVDYDLANKEETVTLSQMIFERIRQNRIKQAATDMLWHFHLPEATLPDLLKLYEFVKGKVSVFHISDYGDSWNKLKKCTERIRDDVFKNKEDAFTMEAREAMKEADEIVESIYKQRRNKQGKYKESDRSTLDFDRKILILWKNKLEIDESKDPDFLKELDDVIRIIDETIKMIEVNSDQKPSETERS